MTNKYLFALANATEAISGGLIGGAIGASIGSNASAKFLLGITFAGVFAIIVVTWARVNLSVLQEKQENDTDSKNK